VTFSDALPLEALCLWL